MLLKRNIPDTGALGRCAVVPPGNRIELVALNATTAFVVCVLLPKLAVPVAAFTKNTLLVVAPLTAKLVLAPAPLTVMVPPAFNSLMLLPVRTMLAAVTEPAALTKPPVSTLPAVALPAALTMPAVSKLPAVALPVAIT